METQFPLPAKSRMKLLEGQNAPFSYPFWGEGVLVLRLFCQRFRVIKQDTGEFKKLFILTPKQFLRHETLRKVWQLCHCDTRLLDHVVGGIMATANALIHGFSLSKLTEESCKQMKELKKKATEYTVWREMAQTYARLMEISRSVICRVLPSGPKCDSR